MIRHLVLLFGIVILAACSAESQKDALWIETQAGERYQFTVELALTDADRARGLMFREALGADEGMLFVFDKEDDVSFWMKNTLIPLDMMFIEASGIIHHIHENAIPEDLTPIESRGRVLAVLEINGGLLEKLDIRPGDRVIHPLLDN